MNTDAIYNRRSIRKFMDKDVPTELIQQMLDAGRVAPSAKNRQPWKYIVFGNEQKSELLQQMENGILREEQQPMLAGSAASLTSARHTLEIMRGAPIIIMVMNTNGASPFVEQSVEQRFTEIGDSLSIGASIENILLKATELELGTLWIGNTRYAYAELTDFIGTKNQLIGAIAVGYPDEKPEARPRKVIEDIVEYRI